MTARGVLFLLVGLPGAGKTTRAREIERTQRALRFTPDEWMIPLFGEAEAGGKRDILEGRLIWVALRAIQVGVNAVLDFGFWARDERAALVWLAEAVGAGASVIYVEVDEPTRAARIEARFRATPDSTFAMSAEELARWRAVRGPERRRSGRTIPSAASARVRHVVGVGLGALAVLTTAP